MIEEQKNAPAQVVFRQMSQNTSKGQRMATDEELLLEIVDELKDVLEADMPRARTIQSREDDPNILFPTFMKRVEEKADEYKDAGGYRRLCSVPSFTLALVSVARIRRHYKHCSWFKISVLQKMVDVHGGVSGVQITNDEMADHSTFSSSSLKRLSKAWKYWSELRTPRSHLFDSARLTRCVATSLMTQ